MTTTAAIPTRETTCQTLTIVESLMALEPLCKWGAPHNQVSPTTNRIRSAVILLRDALETEN